MEPGACTAPATLCRPCTANASAPSSTTRESYFPGFGTRSSLSPARTTRRPCSTTRSSRAGGATGPRWPARARAEAGPRRPRTQVSALEAERHWSLAARTPWPGRGRSAHGDSGPRVRGPGSASHARSRMSRSPRWWQLDRHRGAVGAAFVLPTLVVRVVTDCRGAPRSQIDRKSCPVVTLQLSRAGAVAHPDGSLSRVLVGREAGRVRQLLTARRGDRPVVAAAVVLKDQQLHRLRLRRSGCNPRDLSCSAGLVPCGGHASRLSDPSDRRRRPESERGRGLTERNTDASSFLERLRRNSFRLARNASAAGESASALGVWRGVVELVMVVEGRLVRLGELLALLLDVGRGLDLLLGHRHLQPVGTHRDAAQGHEGQVAANEALLDRAELRLVVLDVDVDVLELADLLPLPVNQHLSVPLGHVPLGLRLLIGHRIALSSEVCATAHAAAFSAAEGASTNVSMARSGSMWLLLMNAVTLRPTRVSIVPIASPLITRWMALRCSSTRRSSPASTSLRSLFVSVSASRQTTRPSPMVVRARVGPRPVYSWRRCTIALDIADESRPVSGSLRSGLVMPASSRDLLGMKRAAGSKDTSESGGTAGCCFQV